MTPLRVLARQAGLLLSSSGLSMACAVASVAINARALGVVEFGVLSLIQAYVALIASLATLESWQPVIRLGHRLPDRLGAILCSATFLDWLAALAAAIVGSLLIITVGGRIGINPEHKLLGVIYCASLLAGVSGAPKGYFRLRGMFRILAGNQAALGLATLATSVVLAIVDAPLLGYIISFSCLAAAYNLSLWLRMLILARSDGLKLQLSNRMLKLVLRTSLGTSLLSSFVNSRRHIALLIVGYGVGSEGAGAFSVAGKLCAAVGRLGAIANQIIFPEVMRRLGKGGSFTIQDLWRVTASAAIFTLFVAGLGAMFSVQIVSIVAGAQYDSAPKIFTVLLFAESVLLAGVHFNGIVQQRFGPPPLIWIAFTMTCLMIAMAAALVGRGGSLGVAFAVLSSAILGYCLQLAMARRSVES